MEDERNLKFKTFRFKEFNKITGKVQTRPTGGILLAYWVEDDKMFAAAVCCPKNKVFHKETAKAKLNLSKTCIIKNHDALHLLFAQDCTDYQHFACVKSMIAEIIDSYSHAAEECDEFKQKMKYSGASVYQYAK